MHHAEVAVKVDFKKMIKQRDRMMQENLEVDRGVQTSNFSLLWECYSYF